MSPRNSPTRYLPNPKRTAPQGQAPNPSPDVSNNDTPAFTPRPPWNTMVGGLPQSGSSTPERTAAFSTTILDSIIPFVYGQRKVSGLCAGRSATGLSRAMIYVFAWGEQDSITSCKINGENISGLSWVSNIAYRYGTGSETMPSGYAALGTNANFAKYAYVAFTADLTSADCPGSFDVTAVLGGQIITDFRTSTDDAYTSPALVAYDIMTNAYWRGVSATKLDTDQWEAFADWCDDSMSDSTARFAFAGVIYERDPDAAITEVLSHGFASMYLGADGKFKISSEADPPPITGEWSATASATITEDSTSGAATTEVEAGDILYVGTNVRTVVSVTDDDTIVLDSAVTVSGVTVRKTSGVYLRKENIVRAPTGMNVAPGEIPDDVIVNHTQSSDWGSYRYPAPGDVTGDKRVEFTASGCTNASQAKRMSQMTKNLKSLQPFVWSLIADGTAAGLEPGDICFFDDDETLTMQAARVLDPVVWLPNGLIQLSLREYDPNVTSTATEVDDTPPSITPMWTTDDPDAPTAATQTFGEAGKWDSATLLPDPDDLTTGQGWTMSGGASSAYSAVNDLTTITSGGAFSYAQYALTVSADYLATCLVKTSHTWYLQTSTGAATNVNIEIPSDGRWHRISALSLSPAFNLRFTSGGSSSDTIEARRCRAVEWDSDQTLTLYERWKWTEHASAPTSVATYQMVDADNTAIVVAEVPQGSTALEHSVLILGVLGNPDQWGGGATTELTMRTVGINRAFADFPAPTQAIETRTSWVRVDASGFSGVLSSSDTDVETALATIDDHVHSDLEILCPVSLSSYIDKKERNTIYHLHGGIDPLDTGSALDSSPTNVTVTAGTGKIMVVINAGSDVTGSITVTGTSVDRNTGAETGSDTDVLTVDALTTDASDTDASGNTRHAFTGAYITSKWFKGSVTLSTADLTLTDVDTYQVAFEQWNDSDDIELQSFDITAEATNGAAWLYAYLYSLQVTGDKCDIVRESSLDLPAAEVTANKYYRLRRGLIGTELDGSTDGIWVDLFPGPLASTYWEDINVKVWAVISKSLE